MPLTSLAISEVSTSIPSSPAKTQTNQPQVLAKLISFRLQSPQDPSRVLNFGVAISQVQRILNQTIAYGSGTTATGLVNVGDQQITLIDLSQLIFGQAAGNARYLVVLHSKDGGSFGIPIYQSPSLVEIAADQLKPLPASYRAMDTLGIASHVGKAQSDDGELVVFMLDLERLVSHLSQ